VDGGGTWTEEDVGPLKDVDSLVILDPNVERLDGSMSLLAPFEFPVEVDPNLEQIVSERMKNVANSDGGELLCCCEKSCSVHLVEVDEGSEVVCVRSGEIRDWDVVGEALEVV